MNAHLNPAGYYRVFVPTQPCSIYYHSATPKSGTDAHRDAANLGVPQLIIDNLQENNDVSAALWAQNVYQIAGAGSAVWLGITDSSTTYSWRVMATGQPATFFNWTAGDPNNLRPGCYNGVTQCSFCTGTNAYWCAYGEDCAIMQASGMWLDNSCQGTTTGNPGGPAINRIVVLEINTCPVIAKRDTTICAGNPVNLSASVVSGGTAPYSYTWTPGPVSGPTLSVSPTTTSTYTVEVSDHYLCKTDSTVRVTVNTPVTPTINAAVSPVCKNTNDNISLSVTSPTATYTWSFGNSSSIVSGSGAGPYSISWSSGGVKTISVTVTDNGCSTTATRTLTVDSADATFTINPITTCVGQNITATITHVSPTATYTWGSAGGTPASGSGSSPYSVSWPSPGTMVVGLTVSDNGCNANSSVNVNITSGATPTFTLSPSGTACAGQPVTVTVTSTASGAATYNWTFDGGTVASGTGVGPYTINWTTPGTKNIDVTVTDGGCSGTATQSINVLSSITSDAGPDVQICPGVAGQLGAAPTAGYTYSWSPTYGLSSATAANPTILIPSNPTGITIDTFYVLTTTSGVCSATDTVRVRVYPDVTSTFTISPATTCQGSNVTITYTGNAGAGAMYNWNFNGGTVVSGTGAGPYTVNWGTTGSQNVDLTVTNNGCPSNTTNTVNISNSISVAFTLNPSITACAGQPVDATLTGAASGTATYTWDFHGGNIISGSGAGPYSVSWNANGTQSVDLTVTDGGCTGTAATQSITIANTATADAGADITLCPGVQGNLGSAPVSGYTYSWTPSYGLSSATVSNPTITIPSNPTGYIIDTVYVVTVTSGTCTATDSVNVRIYPDIDNSFVVSTQTNCTGQTVDVTYVGNATAAATFTWNFSGATIISGSGVGPYTISWTTPGSKTVSLDVTDNGCHGTPSSTTITVGPRPTAIAGSDQTVCSGAIVPLGSPAVTGVTYAWIPAAYLSSATASDPTFSKTNTSGANDVNPYMLIADGGGCPDTAYVTITVTPVLPMSIVLSGPATFCQGDSVILSDNLSPQADYLWSDNETTATITVKTSGAYTLTAHDANGCQYVSDQPVTITVNPNPTVALATNGEVDESCTNANDGSLTVAATSGTPSYNYVWNTTPTQNGATATNLAPGSYSVAVTDNNGCTATASFSINAAPFIGINVDTFRNVSCYQKKDAVIYTSVTGGNQPISYLWSNGAVTPAITNLDSGTYTITATDARGCQVDTSLTVVDPGPIIFTPTSPLHIVYGGQEQIEIAISPNVNYVYNWTPGTALTCTDCPNPVASPLQTTTYILSVTNQTAGCTGIDTVTLFVDPTKRFFVPNIFTPNNDGTNDIFQVYASGPVKFFEMKIFDRWGEKVYESNDMGSGWDGTYRGVYASDGAYVYNVTITFLDGQTLANNGSITLLK